MRHLDKVEAVANALAETGELYQQTLEILLNGSPPGADQGAEGAGRRRKKVMPSDSISEDDLNTFEGFLRLQAVDPLTATPDELAMFRRFFDEAMAIKSATPKLGALKFKAIPGELRYAVAVRAGSDLWLTMWVRRAPKATFTS